MSSTYLGIDIGTSGVKTILMGDDQVVCAEATAPLEVSRPRPGWSEQDPADWWAAVTATLDELTAKAPERMSAVRGIGLSGHMHGATLLDAQDAVLRPCILWNDGRSAAECDALEKRADFRGIGGNVVMPGFTAPKLEWVRTHEPDIFSKTARVLLPKDYVRLCLTGEAISEMSDSAGTLWMDVKARNWSEALLEATGLSPDHMPRLTEGSEPAGILKPELTRRWGMTGEVVVAGGGGDNAASACGVGAVRPGSGFLSLGTSGVLFVSTAQYAPNTDNAVHAFCHAVPEVWHQMGVILSATDSLNWLARMTGRTPQELSSLAGMVETCSVTFLPYLSGERTPHNNGNARASFTGLSQSTDTAEMARAVLEGVAFALADCLTALRVAGTEIDTVFALGGGAKSDLWLQIVADVTGLSLDVPQKGDFGAAFGAARLALTAATGADPMQVCAQPATERRVEPDAGAHVRYGEKLELYRKLYPALMRG